MEKAAKRPQDVAQKKLDVARTKVSELSRNIARLSTRLRAWERRATRYAKRASMTDAEVEALRLRRVESKSRRESRGLRRGIRLPGGAS